ncbi:MAG: LPS export ABC transporter periplasmic protein LptC [Candidatus Schekmanbacteria bacterium]|nr:LPS export ABC transporter periplasmic protein LptC [Candidatus Schekmanbacteria bacterium]
MKKAITYAIAVVAAGVVVWGAYSLYFGDAGGRDATRPESASQTEPAALIDRFCRQFLRGDVVYELCARRAEAAPIGGEYRLWDLSDTYFRRPDGSVVRLEHADFATVNTATNWVELKGNIHAAVTSAANKADAIHLEATSLVYDPALEVLSTPGRVKIAIPKMVTFGSEMKVEVKTEKLFLDHDVRTVVHLGPGTLPEAAPGSTAPTPTPPALGDTVPLPMTITAGRMGYDHATRVAGYVGSPRITQGRNTLTGLRMVFHLDDEDQYAEIHGEVRATLFLEKGRTGDYPALGAPTALAATAAPAPAASRAGDPVPITVASEDLRIDRNSSTLTFREGADLKYGDDWLSAHRLEVLLDPTTASLTGVMAWGNVRARAGAIEAKGGAGVYNVLQSRLTLSNGAEAWDVGTTEDSGRFLAADSIVAHLERQTLVADGNVSSWFQAPPEASTAAASTDPGSRFQVGGLELAPQGARVTLHARRVEADLRARSAVATGDAQLESEARIMTAERIQVSWDEQRRVTALLASGEASYAQGTVRVAGNRLSYDGRDRLWMLVGQARVWDESRQIRADELHFAENEGVLSALGHVEAEFAVADRLSRTTPQGRGPEFTFSGGGRTVVTSDRARMYFERGSRSLAERAEFHDNVSVVQQDRRLSAGYLEAWFDGAPSNTTKRDIVALHASRDVRLAETRGKALADELHYARDHKVVVLLGKPALVKSEDRETQGRVIRYALDTRRYTVLSDPEESGIATLYPKGRPAAAPTTAATASPTAVTPLPQARQETGTIFGATRDDRSGQALP